MDESDPAMTAAPATGPAPGPVQQQNMQMAGSEIKTSLTTKLLWTIIVISTILVVITSVIEIAQERDDFVQAERSEAQAAVSANRDALSLALWSFDQRALGITMHSLIRGTSIFRVEVVEDGKTLLKLDRFTGPTKVDYAWQVPLFRPNTNETIGLLRISESYADVLAQVRRHAGALIIAEIGKILALSVLIFFLVHRWITRPLSLLAAKVHDVAISDGNEKIVLKRPPHGGYDEIDALIDAINFNHQERRRMEAEQRSRQAREAQTGKLDALGRVAGGVAHDFNNILGAILGFARLLAQDLPGESLQHHFVKRILAASERGRELVEQVLAFTRGRGVERKIIDLQRVVRQSETLLSASFAKTTHARFKYDSGALPVLGNEARLGQLVSNLCLNANEALCRKPGLVAVEVGRVPRDELESLKAAGPDERLFGNIDPARDYVRLRVSDSGAGIPREILDRIFEPFFTTKGRQHGTGLGLAVVQGVVESHGGICHVLSRPGGGARFSVYLPLEGGLPAAAQTPKIATERLVGNERILVVDDEADIVDALVFGLERLGYETVGVNDPVEALEAFAEAPFAWDLVVTDQVMPGMRGLELVKQMKAIRGDIKIVLCTGYSDNIDEVVSREAGVDAFHIKPVDAVLIAPSIRRLMDAPADA
jgi:signal transduction histidine kinase/ActR/RegA family two-component response regulator